MSTKHVHWTLREGFKKREGIFPNQRGGPHSQSQLKGRGHTIQMSDKGFIVTRNSRQTKSFQQNWIIRRSCKFRFCWTFCWGVKLIFEIFIYTCQRPIITFQYGWVLWKLNFLYIGKKGPVCVAMSVPGQLRDWMMRWENKLCL